MVYITGDIHGNVNSVVGFCEQNNLSEDDLVVLLGDVALNYYGDKRDNHLKKKLRNLKPSFLCIHGNHENRPQNIERYYLKGWCGGMVYIEDDFPNIMFAKDGEIYHINGKKMIVLGGAYSVDKYYRLLRGYSWWADEQPSEQTKLTVDKMLKSGLSVDIVLSHTCPYKYIPREMFLPMIDQSTVDNSTELWLDKVEDTINYNAWYCGHWHTDKRIDKMHFLYKNYETIENT